MQSDQSRWLLITGVSTAGKSFIGDCLPESMFFTPISDTTRKPRSHEMDGVDYHFVGEGFDNKLDNNLYVEHTKFVGNLYGLCRNELTKDKGRIVAHVCDWEGLNNLHDKYSSVRVFIDIQPKDILKRMLARWMDNRNEDLTYLASRIYHALTAELDWSGEVDIYYKDSDEFKADMPNLIDSLLVKDTLYTPFKMERKSPYHNLSEDEVHKFLVSNDRPKRGSSHQSLTESLYSIIEQVRVTNQEC